MIVFIFMLFLSTTAANDRVQQIVVDLLKPDDLKEMHIDTIPQPYFEDLVFLEVDTGYSHITDEGLTSVHPVTMYEAMRIAVDPDGRVFKLHNFDSMEFDDLIYRYPQTGVELSVESIWDYGRFFVEVSMISSFREESHYVTGTDEFIEFNREVMVEEYTRSIKKKLEKLEDRLRGLSPAPNFDLIKFDRKTQSFIVDYYIWFANNGDFRHISLSIEWDGECTVIADEILLEKLGQYDDVRGFRFAPSGE